MTELVVFLASPSDLAEERAVVRTVVDETNALIANWVPVRFRVAGWENTLPSAGRPQALINPEVEHCDLFLGLLNLRWGSPTGEYSSGFEEEYTLAQARHDKTGEPTLHLFFRQVPQSMAQDPGESLRRVLAFKQTITTERRALYRQFNDPHDLARQVQNVLLDRAFPAMKATESDQDGASSEGAAPSASQMTAGAAVKQNEPLKLDEAREQMSSALDALLALVQGDDDQGKALDVDRIELLGRAFGRDRDILGGHFVNRLFRRRRELVLAVGEARLWLRSLLTNVGRHEPDDRTIPGWGALAAESGSGDWDDLVKLASSDEPAVALGAIRVMSELGIRPPALFPAAAASAAAAAGVAGGSATESEIAPQPKTYPTSGSNTSDLSQADRADGQVDTAVGRWVDVLNAVPGPGEAVDLFLACFDPVGDFVARVIEAERLNEKMASLLAAARSAASGDPQVLAAELAVLMFPESRTKVLRSLLIKHLQSLDDEALAKVAQRAVGADLAAPAVELAIARGLLTPEVAAAAIDWKDRDHLARLIDLALDNPDIATVVIGDDKSTKSADVRATLLSRTQSKEDLRSARASKPWDLQVWDALLMVAGPEEVDDARRLLDTEGANVREQVRSQLAGRDDLVEFVVTQQVTSAGLFLARRLSAPLTAHTERAADFQRIVQAARLAERNHREAFVRALANAVDLSSEMEIDAVTAWLRDIASDLYVAEREAVFASPLAEVFSTIAVEGDDVGLRAAAKQWAAALPTATDEQLLDLIYDSDSDVRMAAIRNLLARWDDNQLEELLDGYASKGGQYWYNVIVALDDHLYAPRPRSTDNDDMS